MELTGKCKEDFENWFNDTYFPREESGSKIQKIAIIDKGQVSRNRFYYSPAEMKFSVYVDFFDSKEIHISTSGLVLSKTFIWDIGIENNVEFYGEGFKTRVEARTAAIEKANEPYNTAQ